MKSVPTCLRFTDEAVRIWSKDDQLDEEERLAEEKETKVKMKRKIVDEEEVIENDSIWTEMSTVDESNNAPVEDTEDEPKDSARTRKKHR